MHAHCTLAACFLLLPLFLLLCLLICSLPFFFSPSSPFFVLVSFSASADCNKPGGGAAALLGCYFLGYGRGRRGYAEDMKAALLEAQEASRKRGKVVVWRESTAQHFRAPGGEYPAMDGDKRWQRAMGEDDRQWAAGKGFAHKLQFGLGVTRSWREHMVLEVCREIGLRVVFTNETHPARGARRTGAVGEGAPLPSATEVNAHGVLYWVPFYHASSARWDLHPRQMHKSGGEGHHVFSDEATHYCSTPLLWAPIYDGMARAMELAEAIGEEDAAALLELKMGQNSPCCRNIGDAVALLQLQVAQNNIGA